MSKKLKVFFDKLRVFSKSVNGIIISLTEAVKAETVFRNLPMRIAVSGGAR